MSKANKKVAEVVEAIEAVEAITETVDSVLEVAQEQVIENQTVMAKTEAKLTKAAISRRIFAEEQAKSVDGKLNRTVILERFENEAGLSRKGATTYYQNLRDKAGYVQHKTA